MFSPQPRSPGGLLLLVSLFLALGFLQSPLFGQDAGEHSDAISIRLERADGDEARSVFKVFGWRGAREFSNLTQEEQRELFAVYVDADSSASNEEGSAGALPPVIGTYQMENGVLGFEPRYPLQPGLRYRAVFRPPHPTGGAAAPITAVFEIPKPDVAPTAIVEHVYPTTDRLPENQLKFYLHFSAPMSRGEAYRHIELLDEEGRPVELPFLELDQELWDVAGKRLTLLFDPGRVKRDLMPNRDVGPPLQEDRTYTLVIDRNWLDAEGNPLKADYRKAFHVAPPDRESPDLDTWRLTSPRGGTTESLTVEFPEPLDQALLFRLMDVVEPTGRFVDGVIAVDKQETRWRFTPARPWKPGRYYLSVGTSLEDLAGNSVGRPFEVESSEGAEERGIHIQQTRRLRFDVPPVGQPRTR